MNTTFKLVTTAPQSRNCESVKLDRKRYAEWFPGIPIDRRYEKIIYVNESPLSLHMIRNHCRALRGQTPNPVVMNSRGDNITMILAVSAISVVRCEAVFENVNHLTFQAFLKKLEDVLRDERDSINVMDNIRFHHSNHQFYDNYRCEAY